MLLLEGHSEIKFNFLIFTDENFEAHGVWRLAGHASCYMMFINQKNRPMANLFREPKARDKQLTPDPLLSQLDPLSLINFSLPVLGSSRAQHSSF